MDIIERLKQWQDFTSNLIDADDLKETLSGAIDEIERLREGLKEKPLKGASGGASRHSAAAPVGVVASGGWGGSGGSRNGCDCVRHTESGLVMDYDEIFKLGLLMFVVSFGFTGGMFLCIKIATLMGG